MPPEAIPLMLTTIALDLQFTICTFLHPSDILALRKTCRVLELTTRQRIVWIEALHRVCLDNNLFLPSFPMPDMSVVELERAAMAPHKWINLCAVSAKQQSNDYGAILRPTTMKIIRRPFAMDCLLTMAGPHIFLVPGGRYLVNYTLQGIKLWDLGYTPNTDYKLLASVGPEGGSSSCMVNATSDGMGLIVVASHRDKRCSVYEIYPQRETPRFSQIADPLLPGPSGSLPVPSYLLPDKVIWYNIVKDGIVFTVWDYRLNHSASFSVDVEVWKVDDTLKVIATKTTIIVLCEEAILVWSIPPLLPQLPHFPELNHEYHTPPLFRVAFPDNLLCDNKLSQWKVPSSWYFGTSKSLYVEALCQDSESHGLEIVVEPDLSDVSLRVMNTSQFPPAYFFGNFVSQTSSICEDSLVSCWHFHIDNLNESTVYVRSTSSPDTNAIFSLKVLLSENGFVQSLSLCPASGRFVHLDGIDNDIVIVDFL